MRFQLGSSILLLLFSFNLLAGQVIRRGNGAEPKDLDPQTETGEPENNIMENLFEPLAERDPKTLESIPGAAESWTVSKDLKSWTFKLRKEAKWSNGEPVTAKDFVYAWHRLLNPATAAQYATMGYLLKNGEKYNKKEITDPTQVGVKAVDDFTLQVELENPTPYFLQVIAYRPFFPVLKSVIEKHGRRWTRPENMVTNGPFIVKEWKTNKVVSLVPNPHYWDRKTIKLERVDFLPIEKQATEEKMFRKGEIDLLHELPNDRLEFWQKDTSGVFRQFPFLSIYYYWINVKKAPLDNPKVRKALALGFDREQIVKYVTRGGQKPAQAFTPPGAGDFHPKPTLPTNLSRLAEAKKLLAEAGYPEGKGLPSIQLLYNTSDNHKKIAEAIQQMWQKNLGVKIELLNQEWKVFLNSQSTHDFQISRAGWTGDYNDPNTFLDMFVSDSFLNHANYSNPKYDELYKLAAKEIDKKKRLSYFQQMEDLILEELPVIPIYVYTRSLLVSKKIKGWYPNLFDFHPMKYMSIE